MDRQSIARALIALVAVPFLAECTSLHSDNAAPKLAERSSQARAAFVKSTPCPATGKTRGACPGYVVDHIKPLCADGADHPSNMQWQTIAAAKEKDRQERLICKAKSPRSTGN